MTTKASCERRFCYATELSFKFEGPVLHPATNEQLRAASEGLYARYAPAPYGVARLRVNRYPIVPLVNCQYSHQNGQVSASIILLARLSNSPMDGIKQQYISAITAQGIPINPTGLRRNSNLLQNQDTPTSGNINITHTRLIGRRRNPKEHVTRRPRTNVVTIWIGTTANASMVITKSRILFAVTYSSCESILSTG